MNLCVWAVRLPRLTADLFVALDARLSAPPLQPYDAGSLDKYFALRMLFILCAAIATAGDLISLYHFRPRPGRSAARWPRLSEIRQVRGGRNVGWPELFPAWPGRPFAESEHRGRPRRFQKRHLFSPPNTSKSNAMCPRVDTARSGRYRQTHSGALDLMRVPNVRGDSRCPPCPPSAASSEGALRCKFSGPSRPGAS